MIFNSLVTVTVFVGLILIVRLWQLWDYHNTDPELKRLMEIMGDLDGPPLVLPWLFVFVLLLVNCLSY